MNKTHTPITRTIPRTGRSPTRNQGQSQFLRYKTTASWVPCKEVSKPGVVCREAHGGVRGGDTPAPGSLCLHSLPVPTNPAALGCLSLDS